MPNRQYERGTRFEHKVIDHLSGNERLKIEGLGYVVVRAAGSKGDSKADLIAFHPERPIMLVQCKIEGKISKEEWDRLLEVASWYPGTCVPVVASNGPKGRGVTWVRLDAERIPYARVQPCRPYYPCCGEAGFSEFDGFSPVIHDHEKLIIDRQSPDYHG